MNVPEIFRHSVKTDATGKTKTAEFVVKTHPRNLLGIKVLCQLQISVDLLLHATNDWTAGTN